ncbi:aminoacyl-tRNA hydrolase [Gammaproteobacteria bacterium ESL0073]|uniref:Peptidyl-tRNA hydrolase n=1 Tax=Entomomonas moraniae TaxID=2213226 RepID=A0A3Q9JMK4_9GAMM|nr:aminoacyl-tRNA hydrolase [Entomomonas moraniae]AWM81543.1 aminoacyl-tRNA hydrolase [Gammaproteobacteria bacterium ESL0073]AZS51622.1 aminoacyl-tRNA hydrolase [Entomomonas moraniae]
MSAVQLIVGLGNPGPEYEQTRHNAGALFVESIAEKYNVPLISERKYYGLVGRFNINNQDVKLLIPTTYMNRSGQAVAALANFFRIPTDAILIAHDELDLPPGVTKLKQGGGHGGHNGLRDIIAQCSNQNNFYRLRLGIGHPGDKSLVSNFVLSKAPPKERQLLATSIEHSLDVLPDIIAGNWDKAMQQLHSQKA